MKPYTYILYASILIFLQCVLSFTLRSVKAYTFRKKVAFPHGFSEGIMIGPEYTLLIATLALLLIESALFVLYPTYSEAILTIRVICYFVSVLLYLILFLKTPPLFAYWFGQNGLWEAYSPSGKIAYADIYNARLSKRIRLPIMNNQQLCKFTFFVKGKNIFLHPKKYVCKMTACEISALSRQVHFSNPSAKADRKPIRMTQYLISAVLFFICIVSIALLCVSGIFNEARYSSFETSYQEVKTLSAPSFINISDGKLFVHFDNLKAVNVYSTDGEFLYSASKDNIGSETPPQTEHEGKNYSFSSFGVWYSNGSGEKLFVISYPIINTVLNTNYLWIANAILIFTAIILRAAAGEYKYQAINISGEAVSETTIDETLGEVQSVHSLDDETAAS